MKQQWPEPDYAEVPEGFTSEEPQSERGSSRLAVLGDPIAHSQSPQLQLAAYRALGLDWEYYRWQVPSDQLSSALSDRQQGWRGVSVTAPLKAEALDFANECDELAQLTGAVNTLVFDSLDADAPARGYNTDVYGMIAAFAAAGRNECGTAHILGAGDTAASAVVAASKMGADRIVIAARRIEAATKLAQKLQGGLGGDVEIHPVDLAKWEPGNAQIIVDTIPGGLPREQEFTASLDAVTVLSAAYDPWPTPLARYAEAVGATVVCGTEMLLHQAVYQVRLFSGRKIDDALPNESLIIDQMRAALQGS